MSTIHRNDIDIYIVKDDTSKFYGFVTAQGDYDYEKIKELGTVTDKEHGLYYSQVPFRHADVIGIIVLQKKADYVSPFHNPIGGGKIIVSWKPASTFKFVKDSEDMNQEEAIKQLSSMLEVDGRRLIVRRVAEQTFITATLDAAIEKNKIIIEATHGGSVNNSYGYPAMTEGIVVVASPTGDVWVAGTRLPANKVTLAGVFRSCTGYTGLFDRRFSDESESEIREKFLKHIGVIE